MKLRLEYVTNLAVIAMCIIVSGAAIRTFVVPRQADAAGAPAELLKPGATFTSAEFLQSKKQLGRKGTLILVMSTQCRFCQASMPFYQRLSTWPSLDGVNRRLVVFSIEDVASMNKFLTDGGVRPHAIFSFPRTNPVPIRGTPTLFALDAKGRVITSWTGELKTDEEKQVLNLITDSE